jgi:hypothetical protein
MWSDPNMSPFMAVTAHWIEKMTEDTPTGPQQKLRLRVDLIAFTQVPGRHTGDHLAQVFFFCVDRLKIAGKVCYILKSTCIDTIS